VSFVRRLAVALLLVLAVSGSAAAASADPAYQLDPVDQGWSSAIILAPQDIGAGWMRSGSSGSITGNTGASASCSTPDESDLVLTGGTYSADFSRNDGAYVASSAVVWQTAEQADADWQRNLQPALMGCLAADLQAESTKQIRVVVTSRRQLPWPALAQRSVAYRISLVLRATMKVRKRLRKVSARATADLVAVGNGRARALLWTFSFDRQPLSDVSKQKWAMLMAQRMSSAPR
jgi:hypothetical protein